MQGRQGAYGRGWRLLPLLLVLGLAEPAHAGPWLDPGDTGLRHDLQLLADSGVIGTPVTAWPLSWGDIAAQISGLEQVPDAAAGALARVRSRLRDEGLSTGLRLGAEASIGTEPRLIRDFEDLPRGKGEVAGKLEWTGDRTALRLVAQYVADPDDDRELRADGSYAGLALGTILSIWLMQLFQTDMYAFPFVFNPPGYAFAIAFTLGCVAAAAMVVRTGIDKLDMIAVLKARD